MKDFSKTIIKLSLFFAFMMSCAVFVMLDLFGFIPPKTAILAMLLLGLVLLGLGIFSISSKLFLAKGYKK